MHAQTQPLRSIAATRIASSGAKMVSRVDLAIRALVKVLLALSRTYDIALTVTRDTPEDEILKA